MARSGHIADIRAQIGSGLLLMPSVGNAVLDGDRLLLVRHIRDGRWGTPGGAIEPGESPAEAAQRELREETGLRLSPSSIIAVTGGPEHVVRYPNGDETAYVTTLFAVPWDGSEVRPDHDEVDAARWIAAEQRHAYDVDPLTRDHLEIIFAWLNQPATARAALFRAPTP